MYGILYTTTIYIRDIMLKLKDYTLLFILYNNIMWERRPYFINLNYYFLPLVYKRCHTNACEFYYTLRHILPLFCLFQNQ